MNKLKLKKLLGISTLLGSVAIVTPIALSTTSCANKNQKEWTFTNYEQFNDYLMSHRVDASSDHIFDSNPFIGDYEYVKNNMNLQFCINALAYWTVLSSFNWQTYESLSIRCLDNESAQIDFVGKETDDNKQYKISFVNKNLVVNTIPSTLFSFDFNQKFNSDSHYVYLKESVQTRLREMVFQFQSSRNASITISPFDWQNKQIIPVRT